MSVVLCTLALNEMEWLPKLYEQHKDWPGMLRWVFVESADIVYAETNPEMVTSKGLSIDGTSDFLNDLTKRDSRVTYVPYGFSRSVERDQCKCEARQQYLNVAENVRPNFLFVLDADEFYVKAVQKYVMDCMKAGSSYTAYLFKQIHIWRPPSIMDKPLFDLQVTGGFWDIPHVRGWKWFSGLRYLKSHNNPETPKGIELTDKLRRFDGAIRSPHCIHMAFASILKNREAKHKYYATRGEGTTDSRGWYVESRRAFETWQPGDSLPRDAKVSKYFGPVPECFQGDGNV